MDRISIKEHAKEQIKGKIFQLLAIYLVIGAASMVISLVFGPISGIINFLIGGPIAYAMATIYLGIVKKSRTPDIDDLLMGFKNNKYTRNLVAYIRYNLFVFLWCLLLIVPGIIKAISYSQMFFLLAEDDKLEAGDAQKKSMEMMEGHKEEYFVLILSFIPWFLLCIVTLGIAAIYVVPYVQCSLAEFHVHLVKENKLSTKVAKAVEEEVEKVKTAATKTAKTVKTAATKTAKKVTAKTKAVKKSTKK